MAKAEIIITQDPHGSSAAGRAKRKLDLYSVGSEPIYFANSTDGNIGVARWEWRLVYRPPGSVAELSDSDTAIASLQADVYGRYVVSLRVNNMSDVTPGYAVTVASVSFPSLGPATWGDELGDWDPPAFNEGTYANWEDYYSSANPYGAQQEIYRILYQLRFYTMASQGPGIISFSMPSNLVQRSNAASPSWADAGYLHAIDAADLNFSQIKFGCVLRREGTAGTAKCRVYDVTHSAPITGSECTTTSDNPVSLISSALTVGSSAGNIRNDEATLYKIQIVIDGGTSSDYSNVYDSYFQLVT